MIEPAHRFHATLGRNMLGHPGMPTALLLLLACSQDPARDAAAAYVEAMTPILDENVSLYRAQMDIAEGVFQGTLSVPDIVRRYDEQIMPSAGAIRDRAKTVETQAPELARAHALVVEAWTERAQAYVGILEAYRAGDLAAFDAASAANLASKVKEDQYFEQTVAVLAPLELALPSAP
jgi:hypothetical protein